MKNDRVNTKQLINALIDKTKRRELEWETIPEYFDGNRNEMLRKYIIARNKYFYKMLAICEKWPSLNEYTSFCAKVNGGLVVLFCSSEDGRGRILELGIQPNMDSLIHVNTEKGIADDVALLYDTIENLETDVELFIKGIIGNTNQND